MDMGMVMQVLSPSVQHGEEADLGAKMLGIGRNDAQCLGCGPKQDVIDHGLVLESDLGDWCRHGEDDVEIGHRQQLGLACLKPFGARQTLALRTMPVATGVVGDAGRPAVRALLDMTAQGRCPACRDGADDAMFDAAHVYAMSLPV